MELKGSVILITGASRGIGFAIAEALASEGAHLLVNGRDPQRLGEAAEMFRKSGAEVEAVEGDAGETRDVRRMIDAAVKRWNRLDVAVANAGIGQHGPAEEMDDETWDRVIRTNLRGPFLLTREAIPHLKRAGGGSLVFIASLAGKNPVPNMSAYAATKWGLLGFSRSILPEIRQHKIRILTVCPGSVVTDFGHSSKKLEKADKLVHAEDVAAGIVQALKTPNRASLSEFDIRPTDPS